MHRSTKYKTQYGGKHSLIHSHMFKCNKNQPTIKHITYEMVDER